MGNRHSKKHRRSFSRFIKNIPETSSDTPVVNENIPNAGVIPVNTSREDSIKAIGDNISGLILPLSPTSSKKSIVESSKSVEAVVLKERKYQNYYKTFVEPLAEEEQDRLIQEGNFSAPVRDLLAGPFTDTSSKRNSVESSSIVVENISPPRVLDIACGNGTWLLEMATEFPNSQFYGIDYFPSYPTTVKPANTSFCQYDILNPGGFPYPDNYFDYVFMRQVSNCFSETDWTLIIKEIKRMLKPGGYVEFREADPVLYKTGKNTSKILTKYPSLMKERHGVNVLWSRYMFDYLQDVGDMTDMHRRINPLRFGSTGPVGKMIDTSLRSGFESRRLFFESCLDIPTEIYNEMVNKIVNEAVDCHSFFNYHLCWGRKPLLDYDSTASIRKGSAASVLTHEDKSIDKADMDYSDSCDISSLSADNELYIDQFIEGFEE
ncbi:hypothetical protein INT48_005909 [Thamnidium elegans]|uniref:Methyltransferase domain-containing protein n=1 Tax=Thamnidium elegans TaxID=101142 RepID=A0A8H7SLT9_9FUNG|nr:hypothetical protein INT48_005909 [Thamnidium elegans]